VSLSAQRVTIYDAEGKTLQAPVSTGSTGYETPAGVYSVVQKKEMHHSNLYDDASMPFMQRITWTGIALHPGPLPGYPASHGCVRLPSAFAQHLFQITAVGLRVIVVRDDIAPADIAHRALFRSPPLPPSWEWPARARDGAGGRRTGVAPARSDPGVADAAHLAML